MSKVLVAPLIGILIIAASIALMYRGSVAIREERHEGDLIVSEGTYLIEGTRFIIDGDIVVNGTGRLVVRDSELHFEQEHDSQYRLRAGSWASPWNHGRAEVVFEDVKIFTGGKWMYFEYGPEARVEMDGVVPWDDNIPWHSAGGNSEIVVRDSVVGLTLNGNSSVEAEESDLFLELVFTNYSGVYTLPKGPVEEFDLEIGNEEGAVRVRTRGCEFRGWGATLDCLANVTFVDSELTIGMNAGTWWGYEERPSVRASGLKAWRYEDFELLFDTNLLHLINTEVTGWHPQAFNGATVEVEDSDLADVRWSKQDSMVVVRRSTALMAFASENVTYEFHDSRINGDVTATEGSKIFLYNTFVKGEMREVGGGEIYVDGKRLGG